MANAQAKDSSKVTDKTVEQKESNPEKHIVNHLNNNLTLNIYISGNYTKILQNLHCPFSWNLKLYKHKHTISKLESELKEITDNNDVECMDLWEKCVINLILCYEYAEEQMWDEALDYCEEGEECMKEAKKKNIGLSKFIMGVGIEHICQASRLFIELGKNINFPVGEILNNIVPLLNMDKSNQSSVWAFQSAVRMKFYPDGIKDSLKFIKRAIELEPNCGHWHFLYGTALGRIRIKDDSTKIPEQIEIESLQSAVNLSNSALHKAMLAQGYRELSYSIYNGKPLERTKFKTYLTTLNKDSSGLYRNALCTNPNNVSINIQCAIGFMKLPNPYKNMELAEECINKAVAMAPDNLLAIHTAGTLCYRKKDYSKAKKYFLRAGENGDFGAYMDLLRVKYEENKSFDPIPELKRIISNFQRNRHEGLCQQGSYMFFVKKDFMKALDYWLKVIKEDVHSQALTKHRSIFFKPKARNIIAIILEELIVNDLVQNSSMEKQDTLCDLFGTLVREHPHIDISEYKRKAHVMIELEEPKKAETSHTIMKNLPIHIDTSSQKKTNNPLQETSNTIVKNHPIHTDTNIQKKTYNPLEAKAILFAKHNVQGRDTQQSNANKNHVTRNMADALHRQKKYSNKQKEEGQNKKMVVGLKKSNSSQNCNSDKRL